MKIHVDQIGDKVGVFIKKDDGTEIELFSDRCEITLDPEVADPFNLTNRVTVYQSCTR